MKNHFILTPYFLDEPLPELEVLVSSASYLNKIRLPAGEQQIRMSTLHSGIMSQVEKAVRAGSRPVSICGDCCATIGVVAGLQRAGMEPSLMWFDAHGDFNTWETTPSGFLGGMPLAMLVGRGEQIMVNTVGLQSVSEEKIILTDGRHLDPEERQLIKGSEVRHLTDVKSLTDYGLPAGPWYVHFDVDIVNPIDVAAVSYPASGGPRASELAAVFDYLANTGQVAAVSMSTWNPNLDEEGQSQDVCMLLLSRLLGD